MNLPTKSKNIGGMSVTVQQFAPLRALALQARLLKIFGPALGKIGGLSPKSDISALGPVMAAVFAQIDGNEAQALAREILCSTNVLHEGHIVTLSGPEIIDVVFAGKLKTMLEVLKFALEVNFADFFASGSADKGRSEPREGSPSSSTMTSPSAGPSGVSGYRAS